MSDPLLELENVEVVYDKQFLALRGVSMSADEGNIIGLIGPNGAGKSTVLKVISGVGKLERARVTRGQITYDGRDITNENPKPIISRGVTHILEGRHLFEDLTVEENLRCGLYRGGRRFRYDHDDYEIAFEYFPRLREILDTKAGYISGGEQQMLGIGRALIHKPRLLLLDEPSLGLAVHLVDEIFEQVNQINQNEDVTILVADQNAEKLLELADYGYVIENGQIELHDPTDKLAEREEMKEFFLGADDEGERYKDLKHYKIRKRWV